LSIETTAASGHPKRMSMSRREFLLLTGGVVCAGCQGPGSAQGPVAATNNLVDAGPVKAFAADGVYDQYRDAGFFVVRQGDKLFALSSYCTHRHCKLTAESDRSFLCSCHGSTFSPDGVVTEGPATRNLPVLPVYTDAKGELLIQVSGA
jgi:Rieske Fe-S protein